MAGVKKRTRRQTRTGANVGYENELRKMDDGEPFEDKMKRLVAELHEHQIQARKLDAEIGTNLTRLGFRLGE